MRLDRHFFATRAGIVMLIITGVVLLWAFIAALRPLPDRDLSIATGTPGSAYVQVAERYREILARDGVRLHLVPTMGAVENLRRLRDARGEIGAGFLQAGTTNEEASPELVSLGVVFYEPLWVFCRCPTASLYDLLRERPAARMAIGPVGSATRPLALKLLSMAGLDVVKKKRLLMSYPSEEAARRLIDGEIDVAVMLAGWESPAVQKLLHTPDIDLVNYKRARAYAALVPEFSTVVLPEGVVDLAANRPPADVTLMASKASLVVRKDLHPALQYLLLHAALEVHGRAGIFQKAGDFPAPESIDLPLSAEARHMYKSGPSILQRTLPFWLAELVQRLLILLLPIAGILYPLWSLLPKVYRWQMQRRIFRLYVELRFLEGALRRSKDAGERAQLVARIEDLERRVLDLKIPRSYSEMSFNLRAHVRSLRESAKRAA